MHENGGYEVGLKSAALVKSVLTSSAAAAVAPAPSNITRSSSHRNSGSSAIEDLFFSKRKATARSEMPPKGRRDVLTRLDSLVSGQDSLETEKQTKGILKDKDSPSRRSGSGIRFPDDPEKIQEVIGFGGDENYESTDDEQESSFADKMQKFKSGGNKPKHAAGGPPMDEITPEERSMMNLTRKNTTFNSQSKNLLESPKPKLKLQPPVATEPPQAPLITVRSFGQEFTPGKIITTSFSNPEPAPIKENSKSPVKNNVNDKLNSDGSSENSSDDFESSSTTSSSSGEAIINHIDAAANAANAAVSFGGETVNKNNARLTFLNSTVLFPELGKSQAPCDDEDEEDAAEKDAGAVGSQDILNQTPEYTSVYAQDSDKQKPKITRKSPYVSGAPILKGTPKPSVLVRKPPVAKEKPKIPHKPSKLVTSGSNASSCSTVSVDHGVALAECYSADADLQNAVVIDVKTSNVINEEVTVSKASDAEEEPTPPGKNREDLLKAIRESLSDQVAEDEPFVSKIPVEKTSSNSSNASSSFEANRATIANALGFNRHDQVQRPSTKRLAPKPPTPDVTDNAVHVSTTEEEPKMPKSVLVGTQRHSSMKGSSPHRENIKKGVQFSPETKTASTESELSPISYDLWVSGSGGKAVAMPVATGPSKVVESSFTGQPIHVTPHRPPSVGGITAHPPKKCVNYSTPPPSKSEDEVRKWTEKKQHKRSKSLPRGSEIDEMMGSSKTKPATRFFPSVGQNSNTPVRRQSRVELYENDRRQQRKAQAKFSLKKFFKIGLAHGPYGIQFPTGVSVESLLNSASSSPPTVQFLDKEHEREIVERERNRGRGRPEILHPLDLQQNGVSPGSSALLAGAVLDSPAVSGTSEVVRITPNKPKAPPRPPVVPHHPPPPSVTAHYEKAALRTAGVNKAGVNKSILAKGKLHEYMTPVSSDSGHDSSSQRTEENSSDTSSSYLTSAEAMVSLDAPSAVTFGKVNPLFRPPFMTCVHFSRTVFNVASLHSFLCAFVPSFRGKEGEDESFEVIISFLCVCSHTAIFTAKRKSTFLYVASPR